MSVRVSPGGCERHGSRAERDVKRRSFLWRRGGYIRRRGTHGEGGKHESMCTNAAGADARPGALEHRPPPGPALASLQALSYFPSLDLAATM